MTQSLERMRFEHITLLTGTPIQNNIQELYTLLNILDPEQFAYESILTLIITSTRLIRLDRSWSEFEEKFGNLKEVAQVRDLQTILKKFLVRPLQTSHRLSLHLILCLVEAHEGRRGEIDRPQGGNHH